jgi:hypothetical protein
MENAHGDRRKKRCDPKFPVVSRFDFQYPTNLNIILPPKKFFWALAEQAKRCRKSAPVDGTPVWLTIFWIAGLKMSFQHVRNSAS